MQVAALQLHLLQQLEELGLVGRALVLDAVSLAVEDGPLVDDGAFDVDVERLRRRPRGYDALRHSLEDRPALAPVRVARARWCESGAGVWREERREERRGDAEAREGARGVGELWRRQWWHTAIAAEASSPRDGGRQARSRIKNKNGAALGRAASEAVAREVRVWQGERLRGCAKVDCRLRAARSRRRRGEKGAGRTSAPFAIAAPYKNIQRYCAQDLPRFLQEVVLLRIGDVRGLEADVLLRSPWLVV